MGPNPRQPYDVHAKLEDPMGVLAIALAQWETRDDTRPQPEVRRAANTAMDAIDQMTRELYAIRSRLTGEIRASDDATAARADRLLSRPAQGVSDTLTISPTDHTYCEPGLPCLAGRPFSEWIERRQGARNRSAFEDGVTGPGSRAPGPVLP